jgi:hypothetical protein
MEIERRVQVSNCSNLRIGVDEAEFKLGDIGCIQ